LGLNYEYEVIVRNVKNPRIEINARGNVKVIVPPSQDPEDIIKKKMAWIESKLNELEQIKKQFGPLSSKFLFNGDFYSLIQGEDFFVNPKFKVVSLPHGDFKVLKKWLKDRLRKELDFKVRLFASIMDVRYRKVYIRFQKTKWASCSKKGNLSFNLALMALPEGLRDYVIIHELAHLRIPKHGDEFWGLVKTYYPDYVEAKKRLRVFWLLLEWNEVWQNLRKIGT